MPFEKCPECGETNYQENTLNYRAFDCGFEGYLGRRHNRCEGTKKKPTISIPAEVARYRLAFLDATQVADAIAADMAADGNENNAFAGRCRELARQMREFAGHTSGLADTGQNTGRGNGRALSRFLPKSWSR